MADVCGIRTITRPEPSYAAAMRNILDSGKPSSPAAAAPSAHHKNGLTGWRAALALTVGPAGQARHTHDVHAVLNLLNRSVGSECPAAREQLAGRLADYLAAVHRVQSGPCVTLSGLCEWTRSYAAMRYLMVDAVEPRVDCGEDDIGLRTGQAADMMAFLQHAVECLLAGYTPWLALSIGRPAWRQVEIGLTTGPVDGPQDMASAGWQRAGEGFFQSARFTAIVRTLPRR